MEAAAIPGSEHERLSSLQDYNILDTLPEKDFDDITKIASQICQTPISLVSIIDAERQWFKSVQGLEVKETPRDVAFCAHAILKPQEIFMVPDSQKDVRFADNPLVTGTPNVIFYAGIPLVNDAGFPLGTLCVIDHKPKILNKEQQETLRALANQVVCLLELRKSKEDLEMKQAELNDANQELEKFAYVAAHDLKSPCNNVISLTSLLEAELGTGLNRESQELLANINYAVHNLKQLIDGILRHSGNSNNLRLEKEFFTFGTLMREVKAMMEIPESVTLYSNGSEEPIWAVKVAVMQILLNLCSNAVKYNDKAQGFVKVTFEHGSQFYRFTVVDNGMGIPEEEQENIFDLFHVVHAKDRFQNSGTGIGLNTVQKLVKKLGGKIRITSEIGIGTSFSVTIKK